MKKYISVLILMALITPLLKVEKAEARVQNYWNILQKKQSTNLASRIRSLKNKSQSRSRSNRSYRAYQNHSKTNQKNFANRTRLNRKIYPVNNFSSRTTKSDKQVLQISSRPISINKPISEISDQIIPIFSLGFQHPKQYRTSNFIPAINVDKIAFRLIDNMGIIANPSLFSLVIEGKEFQFEQNGRAVIDFTSFRLAHGESRNIEIGIKAYDPENLPRLNGSFRLRLDSAFAMKESSFAQIPVKLIGPSISKFITLYPRTETSGNPVLAGTPATIFSRTISAGETATVLGLKLGASFEDMVVQKISVRNVFGNSIDTWVNKINLINYSNNTVVASTRFVNGIAKFNIFGNRLQIPRNSKVHLGFEVVLNSTINTSQNTQFKLDIQASDIEVLGFSSGREIPISQKIISLDAQPFFVAQSGGKVGIIPTVEQPQLFATGALSSVYRFRITNNGNREFSVSRFTMNIHPNQMNFAGGGANDFSLFRSHLGREFNHSDFTTTVIGPNTIRFDAQNEIYVPAHGFSEFGLQVALNDTGSGNRSIGIKILGDTNLIKGTIGTLRASGANFIWSDHSGAPHTASSADWISGYLFPGLPTQTFVNKD